MGRRRRRDPVEEFLDACAYGAAKGCTSGCNKSCASATPSGIWSAISRTNWRLSRPYGTSLVALIRLYQRDISPTLGKRCLYDVSCSQYAINAIEQRGLVRGAARAFARVCSCNPVYRTMRERKIARLVARRLEPRRDI